MFASKKSILFIEKAKITVSLVEVSKKSKRISSQEIPWTPETLEQTLSNIKKITGNSVRILLSDEFVYVTSVIIPSDSISEKDDVKEKIQKLIPEDLNSVFWDFKEVLILKKNKDKELKAIQVICPVKSFFEQLCFALVKNGFEVEAIEPMSYTLAHLTKQSGRTVLVAYINDPSLLLIQEAGLVVATQLLGNVVTQKDVGTLIAHVKKKFSVIPNVVVVTGKTDSVTLKDFESPDRKVEIVSLDPVVGLAQKDDVSGKDEHTLNIDFIKVHDFYKNQKQSNTEVQTDSKDEGASSPPPQISNDELPKTPAKKSYLFMLLLLFIVIGVSIGGFFMLKTYFPAAGVQKKVVPSITPTITEVVSEASDSAEIDLSQYSIEILNGSGTPGVAGELEGVLEDAGYNVTTTGNADSYDFKKTQVNYKASVSSEFKKALDKSLKSIYADIVEEELDSSSEVDVQIIVGTNE